MQLAVRTIAMNARTACPFLKEVVMIYCDACPSRKLLPRNQVVSMGPCSSTDFSTCPLYLEIARGAVGPHAMMPEGKAGTEREVKP
jgi:hypothetical protein